MKTAYLALACTLSFLALGSPVNAQDEPARTVSAVDRAGVEAALRGAGYDIEMITPEDGSRSGIHVISGDDSATVFFDDCQEAVPDFCETLVLSTWWDRETPVSDEIVAAANLNHKYVSVFRDNEGDPVMQWAILTRREGIPATVFLNALIRFFDVAREFDAFAFEGDTAVDATAEVAVRREGGGTG